jgi:hypothetical protein
MGKTVLRFGERDTSPRETFKPGILLSSLAATPPPSSTTDDLACTLP